MRRLAALCALMAGVVLLAPAASAQTYGGGGGGGGGGGTPPPEAPPAGCPVEDPPPADPPPCHPRTSATVSDRVVAPGESVVVSTPPAFAPGSPVTINLVRARGGSTPALSEQSTANGTGAVSDSITIPDVPNGVYFVYVVGVDADGNRVVALTPIVIRSGQAQAAAVEGDSFQAAAAAEVPAAVAEVMPDLSPEAEAAVVDAVASGSSGLVLSPDGTLNVRSPEGSLQAASALPNTGNDISGPVTAGAALLLAGTGLVLMYRRKEARQ